MSAHVLEPLGLAHRRAIHLIGAGGKTTLMYALKSALAEAGHTVLTTTSTRIREPEPGQSDAIVLADEVPDLAAAVARAFAHHRHVTVAASRLIAEGKLQGLSPDALAAMLDARLADVVLVEADGAAGRSLKAHREQEPVIAAAADAVVAVIGADAVGRPADDAHVHRAQLFRERLGLAAGHAITPADVAGIVFHPGGWLARVPAGAEVVVFVNKAGTAAARTDAHAIAAALHAADAHGRLGRVIVGDARTGSYETCPRVPRPH
jgi:probable selenium-dependent hydroxylase accessory protein YqeC